MSLSKEVKQQKVYQYRKLQRARGVTYDFDLLPTAPAREAVIAARRRGLTYAEINRLTGYPIRAIPDLIFGRTQRMQRRYRTAIIEGLGEPDIRAPAPNSLTPITVERQIVLCLNAQGWTQKHLAQIIRNNGKGSGTIIHGVFRCKKALAKNLQQIYWLAEVIGDQMGPATPTAKRMQNRGIFPLKHYNTDGSLNERTLNPEQQEAWRRVQS